MCAYRGFGQQVPATDHIPERKMNSSIAESVWSNVEGTHKTRRAPEGPEGQDFRETGHRIWKQTWGPEVNTPFEGKP